MDSSDKDIAKHVRSAKTWLEKAEQSFDRQADIKGELNLMLAEAEMKNLRKNHAAGQKLMRVGAVVTACFLAAAFWYVTGLRDKAEPPVPMTAGNPIVSEAPKWVSTPVLQYDEKKMDTQRSGEAATAVAPAEAVPEPAVETMRSEGRTAVQESIAAEAAPAAAPAAQQVMTDRQVQAAVQDARHSLRGK